MRRNLIRHTTMAVAILAAGMLTSSAKGADASLPAPAYALHPAAENALRGPREYPRQSEPKWRRQWAISLAPLVASQSLDAASSYGMRELNPLLASPNGGFGMKATGVKFGVIGVLAGTEYLLVRKYPRSAKFFAIVNWTTAGATTGLAVHNYRLPRE